ncbi:Uncharacterised protein [Mycobacteroides abscessus subsp. abscessus]|nr:Uncharacterised protein [Mycobacteroides abscessus subsp. abscessus]
MVTPTRRWSEWRLTAQGTTVPAAWARNRSAMSSAMASGCGNRAYHSEYNSSSLIAAANSSACSTDNGSTVATVPRRVGICRKSMRAGYYHPRAA